MTKYPPSLLFILWNVGIGLIVLIAFERWIQTPFLKVLVVFGSVPMFFYLLHLYVLKLLYVISELLWGANESGYFSVSGVAQLWIITLFLICLLYPVVKAFSSYKHANKQIKWLKYF